MHSKTTDYDALFGTLVHYIGSHLMHIMQETSQGEAPFDALGIFGASLPPSSVLSFPYNPKMTYNIMTYNI